MYFVLAGPEPIDHVCKDDQFNVHGAAPVPSICGTNSGQHSKFKVHSAAPVPSICRLGNMPLPKTGTTHHSTVKACQ